MKNNSLGTKILMALVMLTLLAYFGVQAFLYFSDPLTTTVAYYYQVEEGAELSGYVARAEQVLPEEASGLLRLQRGEGERVSVGGTIATVYADQASLDRQTEIDALSTRVEQLEYARETALGAEVSLKLDGQIMQSMLDYRRCLAADRLYDAEKQAGNLRGLVLKRDYTYSDGENLAIEIETAQAELKALKSQAAGSVQRITAPESGLYSAVVDGYEEVLSPQNLKELSPSQLTGLQANSAVKSNVGKLILGDAWYYAAVMTAEEAESLQKDAAESGVLTLRFAKSVERNIPVTIDSIGAEENGRVVVVFRGETFLPQLTLLRRQSAQVVTKTLEGIRVPEEALRIVTETVEREDSTTEEVRTMGVYCIVGMEARFKPVKVLYRGDGFALVQATAPADRESLRLRPRDEVIITALDLYDGKVLG